MNVFSRYAADVMKQTEYTINEEGVMTVLNDTADVFRFPDMTEFVEFFADVIKKAIERNIDFKEGEKEKE